MIDRAIASLVLLKVMWDGLKKDYIEIFVPFVATLIRKNAYDTIEPDRVREDFKQEFGLAIPYHPMIAILTRARKRGLIERIAGEYKPVQDRVRELDFTDAATEQGRKQERVLRAFGEFTKEQFSIVLERDAAESALIGFLKAHDLELLCATQQASVLPQIRPSKSHKYLVSRFISDAYECQPDIFNFIVDMGVGHTLASALLYSEHQGLRSSLRGVRFYLDTAFILRLRGIDGEERKGGCADFLATLKEEGATTLVFAHTYDEVMGILEGCLRWVQNSGYDPARASRALRYFVERGFGQTDVESFIERTDRMFSELSIDLAGGPDPNLARDYQIDEDGLRQAILDMYAGSAPQFDEWEREFTLLKDINTISAVYRLRKGRRPRKISEAGHIFVTTNSALACAVSRFDRREEGGAFSIPPCLTDILIGTIVWLKSPAKTSPVSPAKIIADCYAALRPSAPLLKQFAEATDRLKNEGEITEDEYYVLRCSRGARELLAETTMGDHENFTAETPAEILRRMRKQITRQQELKYLQESASHDDTKKELHSAVADRRQLEDSIAYNADRLAALASWGASLACLLLGAGVVVLQFVPNLLAKTGLRILGICFALAFFLGSVALGLNIVGVKERIRIRLQDRIVRYLKHKSDRGTQ